MKLSILFLLRRNKINVKGLCPIECRITLDSQRKPFSTGVFINPDCWNVSKQKAYPPNKGNAQINTQLSLIKQEINQAFLYLQVQEKEFCVVDIYSQFKGENIKLDKSIKEMFHLHINKQEKLIGITTTKVSVAKFYQTQTHVLSFIKKKYNRSDYLLKDMSMQGCIKKVECEPYQYTIKETGEEILLYHRYEYSPEEDFVPSRSSSQESFSAPSNYSTTVQ